MDDFSAHLKMVYRISIYFLSFCFAGYFLFPEYSGYFLGLLIGVLVSLINSVYLSLKIKQLTDAVIAKSNRRVNMGYLTRASMALLAIIASIKYENIEFSTTLAGLFFVQGVTLLVGMVSHFRNKQQ